MFWGANFERDRLSPIIDELLYKVTGKIKIFTCNADESASFDSPLWMRHKFRLNGVPSFLIFINGKVVDHTLGTMEKHALIEWVEKTIAPHTAKVTAAKAEKEAADKAAAELATKEAAERMIAAKKVMIKKAAEASDMCGMCGIGRAFGIEYDDSKCGRIWGIGFGGMWPMEYEHKVCCNCWLKYEGDKAWHNSNCCRQCKQRYIPGMEEQTSWCDANKVGLNSNKVLLLPMFNENIVYYVAF